MKCYHSFTFKSIVSTVYFDTVQFNLFNISNDFYNRESFVDDQLLSKKFIASTQIEKTQQKLLFSEKRRNSFLSSILNQNF